MRPKHKTKLDQDTLLGKQGKVGAHLLIVIIIIIIVIIVSIIIVINVSVNVMMLLPDVQLRQC